MNHRSRPGDAEVQDFRVWALIAGALIERCLKKRAEMRFSLNLHGGRQRVADQRDSFRTVRLRDVVFRKPKTVRIDPQQRKVGPTGVVRFAHPIWSESRAGVRVMETGRLLNENVVVTVSSLPRPFVLGSAQHEFGNQYRERKTQKKSDAAP